MYNHKRLHSPPRPPRPPRSLRRWRRLALAILALIVLLALALRAREAGVPLAGLPFGHPPAPVPANKPTARASASAPAPPVRRPPTPATRPRDASHVDLAATDPRFGIDEAAARADQADALGARWTRIPFIWAYLQPSSPTSWNSFALGSRGSDAVVNDETARGRAVVGLLLGTPAWARQNAAWGPASVPVNIDRPWNSPSNYWGAYCYRLAKHYKGRIDQWIIWNEVSIPAGKNGAAGQWTQWRGAPAQYARLLAVAYRAIHAANPGATVVLYGDPYWYDRGAYLDNLFALLAGLDPTGRYHGYFDAANLHLYIGAAGFYRIVRDLRRELAARGWGDKEVWIGETNIEPYDDPAHYIDPGRMGFRVTMDEQAGFLVDAFAADIAAGVARVEVYRMYDGAEAAHGGAPLGIVDVKGALRPIGRTFRFLSGLFKGAHGVAFTPGELYPDPTLGGKAGVFKVVCARPSARITVLWNAAGAHARYPPLTDSAGKPYYRAADGLSYDKDGDIVLPATSHPRGVDADAPWSIGYDKAGTATYALRARAAEATVYDKFGNATVLRPGDTKTINDRDMAPDGSPARGRARTTISFKAGYYYVQLRGGRSYTNPFDRRIPTVGGDPVVIVEPLGPHVRTGARETPPPGGILG